jgi:hypothetical protein
MISYRLILLLTEILVASIVILILGLYILVLTVITENPLFQEKIYASVFWGLNGEKNRFFPEMHNISDADILFASCLGF